MMHWETLDTARLNSKRASSSRLRGGVPPWEVGLHNIQRTDESSAFRLRPVECTHVCGTRVKRGSLPSSRRDRCAQWRMADDVRWLCASTCYCRAVRPATTITTTLTRNAGSSDCGAHHDLTCVHPQQSHRFHSIPTANTKTRHHYQILKPSKHQHRQHGRVGPA